MFDLEDAFAAEGEAAVREQVAATPQSASRPSGRWRCSQLESGKQADDPAMCAELAVVGLTLVVPEVESLADLSTQQPALVGAGVLTR